MARPERSNNAKLPFHHPATRFVASAVDGHQYIVAHRAGQEAEAIRAIDSWVENPELNLTPEEGDEMIDRVRGVAQYQVEKKARKKKGGGR